MHILVTGSHGQLGRALEHLFSHGSSEAGELPASYKAAQVDYIDMDDCDISSQQAVEEWFSSHEPYDLVINCAAMTNVDGCDVNRLAAFAANAQGPYNLAHACNNQHAAFVHVSTDYVFAGTKPRPRVEDDMVCPISGYGQSKLAGEALVRVTCPASFIVRTAWLYGYTGKNFVKTMLSLAQTHESISVVDDQFGNPTSAEDLALAIVRIAADAPYGVYHCTCEGTCSWADFAQAIMDEFAKPCRIARISSATYKEQHPQSASRPHYSSLDNANMRRAGIPPMRNWREALHSYATNCALYEKRA